MKKLMLLVHLLFSLPGLVSSCHQPTDKDTKLTINERMANVRAAKAEKKASRLAGKPTISGRADTAFTSHALKATSADYRTPVDKVLKGPNGEAVHKGERGANYYINKNGNKTYLSSNQ